MLTSIIFGKVRRLNVKRICREKTGTDWQTVLDVIKYGEEQQTMKNELQRRQGCEQAS
jgi:hypothetical protein